MTALGRCSTVLCTRSVALGICTLASTFSYAQTTEPIFDAGQERQAIYPVYDGFTRNDDGSLTLSFAYFSHNADPVAISLGTENAFSPDPRDRGQPTTFLPGHHRWQCVMVVDPDFDGHLRWMLSHAGATWRTSDAMLQYNWEFSDRDLPQVLRDIEDATTVPRNICLNRSPLVRVLGYGGSRGPHALQVQSGSPLKLFGSVRDEGLPRDGVLRSMWKAVTGPGTVRFDDSTNPRTLAFFKEPGEYTLELSATDSTLRSSTEVTVIVSP